MGADALTVAPDQDVDGFTGVCLLGMDYCEYGVLSVTSAGPRAAVAISVGTDVESPSNRFKTNKAVPNEDAMCFVGSGSRMMFGVADAHYGPESSHTLIERLYDAVVSDGIPSSPETLSFVLDSLQDGPGPETESETTLLVAVYDRRTQRGFGTSFGDSSCVVAGASEVRLANPHTKRFVSTWPDQLPLEGATFQFTADAGDIILVFTDGINECHYRSPETSVTSAHIKEIVSRHRDAPLEIVSELGALALGGVGGYPGGQDNIALIANQV